MEKAAAGLSNIRSFLVMWNGAVVSENYYGRTKAETAHHVRSITKSIVSALVGIAIDKGMIRSVNDKVSDYIPEHRFAHCHYWAKYIHRLSLLSSSSFICYSPVVQQ